MLQDKVKSSRCDGRNKCHEYAFTTRKLIYFNLHFVTVEQMFQAMTAAPAAGADINR